MQRLVICLHGGNASGIEPDSRSRQRAWFGRTRRPRSSRAEARTTPWFNADDLGGSAEWRVVLSDRHTNGPMRGLFVPAGPVRPTIIGLTRIRYPMPQRLVFLCGRATPPVRGEVAMMPPASVPPNVAAAARYPADLQRSSDRRGGPSNGLRSPGARGSPGRRASLYDPARQRLGTLRGATAECDSCTNLRRGPSKAPRSTVAGCPRLAG